MTQGVVALPDAEERLRAIRAKRDTVDLPAVGGARDEVVGQDVNQFDRDAEHASNMVRDMGGPAAGELPPPFNLEELEPIVFVKLRW